MRNFKKDGGKRDFGRDRFNQSGSNFSEQKTMHTATCAECGDSCQVPFKPRGDKPVYCSHCFGKQNDNVSHSFSKPREFRREKAPESNNNQGLVDKISELINKLDKIANLLINIQPKPAVVIQEKEEEIKTKKASPKKTAAKKTTKKKK
jgi:CxxC-x17-CxxC domain-containing protein